MSASVLASAAGSGWLVRRDPRLRLLIALLFALVTVGLDRPAIAASALAVAITLTLAAGLRPLAVARRLIALEGFMLVLLITLPFTVPGPPLFTLGPLIASEAGLVLALTILLKANAILLALLALIGTLEPVVLGHALARIGVPAKLAHLLLMTIRQIHLIHAEFLRLRQAMRARAFVPRGNRHTWRAYGWLMGMLLVRSLARAERIMEAMRCRGFQGRLHLLDSTRWRLGDTLAAIGLAPALIGLALLDRLA